MAVLFPLQMVAGFDLSSRDVYNPRRVDSYHIAFLVDNSCGLLHHVCHRYLRHVAQIMHDINDQMTNTKFAVIAFGESEQDVNVWSDFDSSLHEDIEEYMQYIQEEGECMQGGNGHTDIASALLTAQDLLSDADGDNVKSIIITVSQCIDSRAESLCESVAPSLHDDHIQIYPVNLVRTSKAENAIQSEQFATHYLSCLMKNFDASTHQICVEDKATMMQEDVGETVQCLLAEMNRVASTLTPTPEPTMRPSTSSPTADSAETTQYPTPEPTAVPTREPTASPIRHISWRRPSPSRWHTNENHGKQKYSRYDDSDSVESAPKYQRRARYRRPRGGSIV
eukprot:CAMPEP_0197078422 /NCGR_PEP_ID=MMETSP1384-20130603/213113_1 /TAXON_ID=29189 /ORGANISM="Ammonia sp." /LENGTH=337 /DNA_ID=CAMNT_0042517289 /DNA_START=59 /DNA_END=1072 /DNA_ORIENTATION=+